MSASSETERAFTTLLEAIAAQQALVRDVEQRGPPPGPALYRSAFDVLVDAALASARRAAVDPAATPALKSAAATFAQTAEAHARARVRVDDHLLALARGWECRSCHDDVPRAAFVSGVVAGRSGLRVDIVCKSCGQRSPATASGMQHFDRVFGALVGPEWNPEVHGFGWDRR
jgi:hypothetical protein